jgi:hypothetical protein
MVDQKHRKPAPTFRVHPDTVMAQPTKLMIEADDAELVEKTATGIVASGHSIHINVGKVQRGYDAMLGKPVFRQEFCTIGPGEEITLPKSQIERLMAAGFLVNPDRVFDDTTTTH